MSSNSVKSKPLPPENIERLKRALNASDIFERNNLVPDGWQTQLLNLTENQYLICCSRQSGKTLTACAAAAQRASTRPGSLILVVAPSERLAKENIKRIAELMIQAGYGSELRIQVSELKFKNKSRIIGLSGARPDLLRGYSAIDMAILDEAAFCNDDLFSTLSPMLATNPNSKLVCLSTPSGPRGWFYRQWIANDNFVKIKVPASQISRIPDNFLEQERRTIGEAAYQREYCCSFDENNDLLIHPDVLDDTFIPMGTLYDQESSVFHSEHNIIGMDVSFDLGDEFSFFRRENPPLPKRAEIPKPPFSYSYIVGIDLAKSQDRSVICTIMTKEMNGKKTHIVCDLVILPKNQNYNKQAQAIADYMDKRHFKTWKTKLVIDASGVGAPVCDNVEENHSLKFDRAIITSGASKRWNKFSRNWLIQNLIKWLAKGNFYISTDVAGTENLKQEIGALRPDYRSDGTVIFVSPEHDDMVMALALGLAVLHKQNAIRSGVTDLLFSTFHRSKCGPL